MKRFADDTSGIAALLFPLFAIAMMGFIGLAVDYGRRLQSQAVLDHALDAAALAAIEQIRSDLTGGQSQDSAQSDANTTAIRVFAANMGPAQATLNATASFSFVNSGTTWTANATYNASVPTTLANLFGYTSFPLQRTASTAVTLGSYLSFYLLLDVSGSMGLPSTNAGQTALAAINPDNRSQYPNGCTLACHFPGNSGYALSRNGGNPSNPSVSYCPQPDTPACIQLRVDAVAYAVQQLISTAQNTATMDHQFSVGLYPFIVDMDKYVPVKDNLKEVSDKATDLTSMLDTGSGPLGSGGTHFENALLEMSVEIKNVGDGTKSDRPKPFLFFVTDGAEDPQWQVKGSWFGSNQATTLDETLCAPIKARGVTIAVLYIPYTPIQNPTDFAGGEDFAANANIPNIPSHLQACASPGFFFTANSPSDITAAMQAMFQASLKSAQITR